MKRLYTIFVVAIVLFINVSVSVKIPKPKTTAYAQGEYARILSENTIFYANPDCTIPKFIIPYSYFVRILQIGTESTKVSYMDQNSGLPASIGYIKTCDLFLFNDIPLNPYPVLKLTLKSDEILFADSDCNYPKTVLTDGCVAVYYGELTIDGITFCYVYASGFIGYVRKNGFASFSILQHELPISSATDLDVTDKTESADNEQSDLNEQTTTKTADETLKTVVIVAVCIVCLSIVYLIFKPYNQAFKSAVSSDDD